MHNCNAWTAPNKVLLWALNFWHNLKLLYSVMIKISDKQSTIINHNKIIIIIASKMCGLEQPVQTVTETRECIQCHTSDLQSWTTIHKTLHLCTQHERHLILLQWVRVECCKIFLTCQGCCIWMRLSHSATWTGGGSVPLSSPAVLNDVANTSSGVWGTGLDWSIALSREISTSLLPIKS